MLCHLSLSLWPGTQRVISFLRQIVEHGGFYRTSDQTWITMERMQFVGACNPPTDPGRKPISHRYMYMWLARSIASASFISYIARHVTHIVLPPGSCEMCQSSMWTILEVPLSHRSIVPSIVPCSASCPISGLTLTLSPMPWWSSTPCHRQVIQCSCMIARKTRGVHKKFTPRSQTLFHCLGTIPVEWA